MPPKKFDPLMLQHNVKQNASDIQNMVSDLNSWEDSIKTRDKKLLKVHCVLHRARVESASCLASPISIHATGFVYAYVIC